MVKSRNYKVNEAKNSQAVLNVQQHSISYTLSKNKAVIEEYTHSDHTDLFQVIFSLLISFSLVLAKIWPRFGPVLSMGTTLSHTLCQKIRL